MLQVFIRFEIADLERGMQLSHDKRKLESGMWRRGHHIPIIPITFICDGRGSSAHLMPRINRKVLNQCKVRLGIFDFNKY